MDAIQTTASVLGIGLWSDDIRHCRFAVFASDETTVKAGENRLSGNFFMMR